MRLGPSGRSSRCAERRPMGGSAMRLLASRLLLVACAVLAVVPATAGAATAPKVTSVAPLKLKIGQKLTIKGSGFVPGKNRNTVVFKARGQRAVFVKAATATKTRLVVKVPAKLAAFLTVKSGQAVATRFQLRVLAKKLSKAYTAVKASPTIAPAAAATSAPAPATKPTAAAAAAAPAPAAAPTLTPYEQCQAAAAASGRRPGRRRDEERRRAHLPYEPVREGRRRRRHARRLRVRGGPRPRQPLLRRHRPAVPGAPAVAEPDGRIRP